MAEVAYIFGDAISGSIIEEIRLTSVSMKDTLDGGEFRATFHLDQTGKTNDELLSATIPGRSFCVVERDGVVIGDYIIWTRTYQSQAKVFQLYGVPIKDYPGFRFVRTDYSATDTEQRNVFVELYNLMQSVPGSIRVALPDPFPTEAPIDISVSESEFKTYRQVMDSIADGSNGFDWVIRTIRSGDKYVRTLEVGYPQIGALPSDYMPIFEYTAPTDESDLGGGNIINYWANDSMADAATHLFGIGGGEGSAMVMSSVAFDTLIANGFPRYDSTYNRKDITDQAILDSLTFQEALKRMAPTSTITAEVKADGEPEFGDYGLGDACQIVIKDSRFPQGFIKETRILGWEYYPPEDSNVEMVRLHLEGEDSGGA